MYQIEFGRMKVRVRGGDKFEGEVLVGRSIVNVVRMSEVSRCGIEGGYCLVLLFC